LTGPFTRSEARALGVTDRVLDGRRFVRLLPRVYRHRDHRMTWHDWVDAARKARPDLARLTGITRIQVLGLDHGPRWPVRLVVEGDLHLVHERIFLHRTKRMPPVDDVGVTPAAAFVAFCRRARVVDAIKVGDWLLHHDHMSVEELRTLALAEQWRDGADEALWVLDHLDGDSRSLPESEVRAVLAFAGLPVGEANRRLEIPDDVVILGDLVFAQWHTVVEYEGSHHQQERACYVADIDRYAVMRRHDVGYVQVTHEKLARPQTLVGEVFRELVSRGYDGDPPVFGEQWESLFMRITDVLGSRRDRRRGGGSATVW
jgi:hypothetical protein